MSAPLHTALSISADLRHEAEELYVVEGLDIGQISRLTGVKASTLSRWRAKYKWVMKKAQRQSSKPELMRLLLEENHRIFENARQEGRELTAEEVKMVSQNAQSYHKMNEAINALAAADIFEAFFDWLTQRYPDRVAEKVAPERSDYLAFCETLLQEKHPRSPSKKKR